MADDLMEEEQGIPVLDTIGGAPPTVGVASPRIPSAFAPAPPGAGTIRGVDPMAAAEQERRKLQGLPAFDETAVAPAEDDDPSYLRYALDGVGTVIGDLGANSLTALANGMDFTADQLEDETATAIFKGVAGAMRTGSSIVDRLGDEYQNPFGDLETALGGGAIDTLGWVAYEVPDALTHIAGAIYAAPAYLPALATMFAHERAENDGREASEATVEDYTIGGATAAVSVVLDRFMAGGAKAVLGGKNVDKIAGAGGQGLLARIARGGIRGVLTEGTSGALEEIGVSAGTQKGIVPQDVMMAALGEALIGAPIAGGIGGLSGPKPKDKKTGGEEGPTGPVSADLEAGLGGQEGVEPTPEAPDAPAAPEAQGPLVLGDEQLVGASQAPQEAAYGDSVAPDVLAGLPSDDITQGPQEAPADGTTSLEGIPTEPKGPPLRLDESQLVADDRTAAEWRWAQGLPGMTMDTFADLRPEERTRAMREAQDQGVQPLAVQRARLDLEQFREGRYGPEPSTDYEGDAGTRPASERRSAAPVEAPVLGSLVDRLRVTQALPEGGGRTAPQVKTTLVDAMRRGAKLARVNARELDLTANERKLNRDEQVRRGELIGAAQELDRAASEVAAFAADDVSSPDRNATVRTLLGAVGQLSKTGIKTKPLVDALKGGDPEAMLDALDQVSKAATQAAGTKVEAGYTTNDPETEEALAVQERINRERESMEDARRNVRRTDGRSGQVMSPKDLAYDAEGFTVPGGRADMNEAAREERASENRRKFGQMTDYGAPIDEEGEFDAEAEIVPVDKALREANKEQMRRDRAAKRREQAETSEVDAELKARKSKKGEARKKAQAKAKKRQFSDEVIEKSGLAAEEVLAEGRSFDEIKERMKSGDLTKDEISRLASTERAIKDGTSDKIASPTKPKTLPFHAYTNTGRRQIMATWMRRVLQSKKEGMDAQKDAIRAARNLAENIIEATYEHDFYRGRWVNTRKDGPPRKTSEIMWMPGVFPKVAEVKNGAVIREKPSFDANLKREYYNANQLEKGPVPPTLFAVDEETGRVISVPQKNNAGERVAPAHYDQLLLLVTNTTDAPDPVAATEALLAGAFGKQGRRGTRGYRGTAQTPTAQRPIDLETVEKPTREADLPPADEIEDGFGEPEAETTIDFDGDMDALAELLAGGLAPTETTQESQTKELKNDIAQLEENLGLAEEAIGKLDLEAVPATAPTESMLRLDGLAGRKPSVRAKMVELPIGDAFAVEGPSGFWQGTDHSETLAPDGDMTSEETLNRLLAEDIAAKYEIAKDTLAGMQARLKELQKGGEKTEPTTSPGTRKPKAADTEPEQVTVAERPADLNPVATTPAPKRKFIDLLGTLNREKLPTLPEIAALAATKTKKGLRPHQVYGASAIVANFKARQQELARNKDTVFRGAMGLFDEPGTGKSIQIAAAAHSIQAMDGKRRVMIMVPSQQGFNTPAKIHQNSFARNIIDDGAMLGLDMTDTSKFHFVTYTDLDAKWITSENYAAVFFDEAHSIKGTKPDSKWAPRARAIKSDFRVFATATPTDMPGQELYYLPYMLDAPMSEGGFDAAQAELRSILKLTGQGADLKTDLKPEQYRNALRAMINKAGARNQIVARALPALSENEVVYADGEADPDAMQAMKNPANSSQRARLTEHAKIPTMVRQTIEALRAQDGHQVIAVFSVANEPRNKLDSLGPFNASPMHAFKAQLDFALREEGLDVKTELYGGKKDIDSSTIGRFQSGDTRVLIMSDSAGATGLNLDDNPEGARAKYKLSYTPESRPRLMLIAGIQMRGDQMIQLLQRHDRSSTQTIPTTRYVALRESEYDNDARSKLRTKTMLQRQVTGSLDARNEGRLEDVNPGLLDLNKGGDYLFSPDRLAAGRQNRQLLDMMPEGAPAAQGARGNAAAVLEALAREEGGSRLGRMAQEILRMPQVQQMPIIKIAADRTGDVDFAGAFDPPSGIIFINPDMRSDVGQIVLHEVVHGVTSDRIKTDQVARARLQSLMDAVKHLREKHPNAFASMDEFVADAFSDPSFQADLQATKLTPQKTAWQRFKDFVLSLFRSRGVMPDVTAFDELLDINVLSANNNYELAPQRARPDWELSLFSPERVMPPSMPVGQRKGLLDAVGRALGSRKGMAHGFMEKVLSTMTFEQIVDTYKGMTIQNTMEGRYNLLEELLTLTEQRHAAATRLSQDYSKKVMDPLRAYMRGTGQRIINVALEPGQPARKMTEAEYLANLMNLSGIGQAHFGLSADAKENSVVKSALKAKEPSDVSKIWRHHKTRFNRLSPEAKAVYNDLAKYFKQQADKRAEVLAGMWLDANFPLEDGKTWTERSGDDIRAKLKATGELPDGDLAQLAVSRDALKEVMSILKPGRVPGAYFPLRRFGRYVVTTTGTIEYSNEMERDALMDRYLGARNNAEDQEITYKAVHRFESLAEAERFSREQTEVNPGMEVSGVMIASDSTIFERDNINSSMLRQFKDKIERSSHDKETKAATLQAFAQVMLEMTPSTNISSTMLPRHRVLGASTDIARVLANYGSGSSYYLSGLQFSKKTNDVKSRLNTFIGQEERASPYASDGAESQRVVNARKLRLVQAEFNKREKFLADPFEMNEAFQVANDVGFGYYLVGASYNLVNMTQVPLYTGPFLAARFGGVKTAGAIKRAYATVGRAPIGRLLKTGGTLTELKNLMALRGTTADFDKDNYSVLDEVTENLSDPNHKRLMEYMTQMGDIDATLAMDFSRTSSRSHVDAEGRPRPQSKYEYLTEWMKMAPHIVEVMNRSVTAIAAFDLQYAKARKAGMDPDAAYKDAAEYARVAIKRTQFVYQNWNKPRVMQGQAMRTVLMFKQHVQNTYYNMIRGFVMTSRGLKAKLRGEELTPELEQDYREARKGLVNFLGVMLLANGAMGGTPEPVKWLMGLMYWLFGDDDEPFNWELMVQQEMADFAGPEMGQILSRGLPSAAGIDLSGRLGINSMLMLGDIRTDTRDNMLADVATTAGGPMLALGLRAFYDAPRHFMEGRYDRAAESATPKAIRDVLRASRIGAEGFVDLNGKRYATNENLDWMDYFAMTLGFTPSDVSEVYAQRDVLGLDRAMMSKRGQFYYRYATAETAAERQRIRADIRAWNARNPDYKISGNQLARSMKERKREERETSKGVYVPRSRRAYIDEQLRFSTQE